MPEGNYEIHYHPGTFLYNIIIGRPDLNQLRAIPSTIHGIVKFPTPWGIAMLVSQTPTIFECRMEGKKQAIGPPEEEGTQDNISLTEHVLVNPAYLEQLVVIGKGLSPKGSTQLKNLLKKNTDIFAWEPSDMTGVPKRIIKHSINANPSVQMTEEDEEKTAFCTNQGTYFYTKMPFGLKNAGERTKAKPKKCSFGVEEGKFLGYMVTSEGIRANPTKTKDIAEMQSPRTWEEMQSLARKLAALNRFLSRSAEKSLPFFETLKDITKENKHDCRWTDRQKMLTKNSKK
nr:reverse transcriptase domain-containing protein [Tanacetum cinerariifolium]